ncbi:hypothetical protein B0H11DRAFT_2218914 [Mycena galericulata]|nr:hypothetical protein B0H11DRAFT_2218914 [Mycena galericulata]
MAIPRIFRLILLAAAAFAVVGAVVAPFAAPVALGLVGFSSIGPVAGTFAAATQAGIGNVVAGSAFACAQSVAAGGALPAALQFTLHPGGSPLRGEVVEFQHAETIQSSQLWRNAV